MSGGTPSITAGFIPLVDAAVLIAARECGFAEAEDLDLKLVRETSWANVRDRLAIGHFSAAHMLAPMAIAGSLGLPPLPVAVVVPAALGAGRNAITVSRALSASLEAAGLAPEKGPAAAARALAGHCRDRAGARPPTFAVVHPYSAHAYLLRYWMAGAGLTPDRDVLIETLPPPYMADALESGRIDGFCVGEPWNSVAVALGAGRIVTTSGAIWPNSPDKVLGLRRDWAEQNEESVLRLVRAVYNAAKWCDDPANTDALATLLAHPDYLDMPEKFLAPGLLGTLPGQEGAGGPPPFQHGHALFPWRSHAAWFLTQMARWDHVHFSAEALERARTVYRPDLYRAALEGQAACLPDADDRVEGDSENPGFFDGVAFDASKAADYFASQKGN